MTKSFNLVSELSISRKEKAKIEEKCSEFIRVSKVSWYVH